MKYLRIFLLICGALISVSCMGQFSIEIASEPKLPECSGLLKVEIDENDGPYSFIWSNGATGQVADKLCAGAYSVTITGSDGCETELQVILSGSTGCSSVESEMIHETISGSCSEKNDGSIAIQDDGKFIFSWEGHGSGPAITNLASGNYCVTIADKNEPKCYLIECYNVPEKTNCGPVSNEATVKGEVAIIVNEISNGVGNGEEFIELVVLKKGKWCSPVDIRGYVIDDNNGDFSVDSGGSSSGVAPGHFRFSDSPTWASVPVGSIILLYNSGAKNPAITLPDDPTDADNDNVYVIPSGSNLLSGNDKSPNLSSAVYSEKEPEPSNWGSLYLYDGGDAVQVRGPKGQYNHGISYGSTLKMTGGPDDLLVSTLSGAGKGYAFTSGSYTLASDFISYDAGSSSETPGAPNNGANASFISKLCGTTSQPGGTVGTPTGDNGRGKAMSKDGLGLISVYPNPFRQTITLEVQSEKSQRLQIVLSNVTGTIVEQWSLDIGPGMTTRSLALKSRKLAAGLYTVSGSTENDGTVFTKKLVKLQ